MSRIFDFEHFYLTHGSFVVDIAAHGRASWHVWTEQEVLDYIEKYKLYELDYLWIDDPKERKDDTEQTKDKGNNLGT